MSETVRILQTLQRMLPEDRKLPAVVVEWLFGEIRMLENPDWPVPRKQQRDKETAA